MAFSNAARRSTLQPSHIRQQTVLQTDTITHNVHLPRFISPLPIAFTPSLNIARPALTSLGYKGPANRPGRKKGRVVVVHDIQILTLSVPQHLPSRIKRGFNAAEAGGDSWRGPRLVGETWDGFQVGGVTRTRSCCGSSHTR